MSTEKPASVDDNLDKYGPKSPYIPTPEEASFITQVYADFTWCYNLKLQEQDILGGVTITDFWDQCNYDYNVITEPQDENDPVVPYASTISRDRSNAFISNLTLQMLYPSVTAQNDHQEIDRIVSKTSRSLLEWLHNNDGRPSMSGQQKAIMYTHKQVVEGTVHVMDNIIDNKLESQLVPNQEIFIPNFMQPDIQKQPKLFRCQENVLYEEANALFGALPRFREHVMPGSINQWTINNVAFADELQSIVLQDRVHIIWMWYDVPRNLFKKYGIPKDRPAAKLFNVMINGVLMFKYDNLMPYHDGLYPISKGIFEHFSDPRYYWGNSMPGKAKHDKKWLDGWKTLIRYKAKLAALPPIITFNGKFIDSDFYIPGSTNVAPTGMKAEDISTIPQLTTGVTMSDINIMDRAEREISEGNMSPQQMGAPAETRQTRGEAMLREENAQKILGLFGQQVAFLVEARTYPILRRAFQFIPKSKLEKIVVTEQSLPGGKIGDVEILFQKMPDMTPDEYEEWSFGLAKQESDAAKNGRNKKIYYVDPKYLNHIDLYVTAVADPMPKKTSAMRRAEAMFKYNFYASDPESFKKTSAAREVVRELGDDENDVINDQQMMMPQQLGMPGELPPQAKAAKTQLDNAQSGATQAMVPELNM